MTDNFTRHRPEEAADGDYTRELFDAGVPDSMHGLLRRHGVGALVVKTGITFSEITAERTVGTIPVDGNTQVTGLLHGGAHMVLAETLGSFAAVAHAGPGRHALGIEIGATHHRGVRSGAVTGTASAIHLGRTLAVHEVVMTDDDGRRLSTARITNLLRDDR